MRVCVRVCVRVCACARVCVLVFFLVLQRFKHFLDRESDDPNYIGFLQFFSYLIVVSNLVPISLYIRFAACALLGKGAGDCLACCCCCCCFQLHRFANIPLAACTHTQPTLLLLLLGRRL